MLNLTKPAGVFAQLFGIILIIVGFVRILDDWASWGMLVLGAGIFLFIEGRQPAKRRLPTETTIPTPQQPASATMIEHMITAQGGQFTYRVLAETKLSDDKLKLVIMAALADGRLREPEPGGQATLVLRDD